MKHLILWGTLLTVSIIAFIIYTKTAVLTSLLDDESSPVYVNVIFLHLGLYLVITQGRALIHKLF